VRIGLPLGAAALFISLSCAPVTTAPPARVTPVDQAGFATTHAPASATTTTTKPKSTTTTRPTTATHPAPRTALVAVPTTTAAPPPPASSFVTAEGTQLYLNGRPYQVVSVNAYELATNWGSNAGCGGMLDTTTLDAFFGSLPTNSMVRMWGFQGSFGTNMRTHTRDWSGLDRVIAAAQRHSVRLIISLGSQGGDCDDAHYKDLAWYQGGYRNVYSGDGTTLTTVSYYDWVREVVTRYRTSPTIAMWEPVNESEGSTCAPGYTAWRCGGHTSCPNPAASTAALRSFFDVIGGEIKSIDTNHLVESGTIGGTQCGWYGDAYATIDASPGIDVGSYHEYQDYTGVAPWLGYRLIQMKTLNKPLIVGELGDQASGSGRGCQNMPQRTQWVGVKINAIMNAGAAGVFMWDWVPGTRVPNCSFDITAGDSVLGLLRNS
jgi:mannan endo-1,4-beta-mannosidase